MKKLNKSRYGAYGILINDKKWLLILKKIGIYQGLWDLPGGGIEFGESPEEALKRELMEEIAYETTKFSLWQALSHVGYYTDQGNYLKFHHLGLIYQIEEGKQKNSSEEEEKKWFAIKDLAPEVLTPLARQCLYLLKEKKAT